MDLVRVMTWARAERTPDTGAAMTSAEFLTFADEQCAYYGETLEQWLIAHHDNATACGARVMYHTIEGNDMCFACVWDLAQRDGTIDAFITDPTQWESADKLDLIVLAHETDLRALEDEEEREIRCYVCKHAGQDVEPCTTRACDMCKARTC